jgi:excisionase family DNA binding protein
MNETKRLLTKPEAADYLRLSVRTLEKYIKEGYIKPIRVGKKYRFPDDVVSTIQNKTVAA